MEVWVTKYALTLGIYSRDAEIINGSTACISPGVYFHGDEWHKTKEDAVIRAEEMRIAKIASRKKAVGQA